MAPNWLVCPAERRARLVSEITGQPTGGHRLRRTGGIRRNPSRKIGPRTMTASVAIACTCGYKGWTVHVDALRLPGPPITACVDPRHVKAPVTWCIVCRHVSGSS